MYRNSIIYLIAVLLVSNVSTFPSLLLHEHESGDMLPALIPDRTQMPSGTVLSNLQMQENNARYVEPEPVSEEKTAYLRSLLNILKISYCTSVAQDGEWKCIYCQPQMTLLLYFHSTLLNDFSGIIVRDDSKKTYYMAFPGTKSVQNVVTDIRIVSIDYPPVGQGTKVHKGIYESYLTKQVLIQKTMLDEMSKNSDYQVVVIGHSLGAGIANIVVLDLYQRNKFLDESNLHLVTVGGPAMWNLGLSYYAASTNIDMIRLTHNNDVVPGFADILKITGFVQSGVEFWNKDTNTVVRCNSRFETPNCINTRLLNPLKMTTAISDHVTYFGQRISQCSIEESLTDPGQFKNILTNL